jgi:hypothetical protein
LRLKEVGEGGECGVGNVVFKALGVLFGSFGGDTDGTQKVDHEAVTGAHAVSETLAVLGKEYTAVRARRSQAFTLEAGNGLDSRGVRDAEAARDVGWPCLATAGQEVRDKFGVIF